MILHDKQGKPYAHTFTGAEIAHELWQDITEEERARKHDARYNEEQKWWRRLRALWRELFPLPRYRCNIVMLEENGKEKIIGGSVGGTGDDYESAIFAACCYLDECMGMNHKPVGRGGHPYNLSCSECVRIFDQAANFLNRCYRVRHERLPRAEWGTYRG